MNDTREIKLCNLTTMKDRKGVVCLDDQGRLRSLNGMVAIFIRIVPNEQGGRSDYSLYIDTVEWMLTRGVETAAPASERSKKISQAKE